MEPHSYSTAKKRSYSSHYTPFSKLITSCLSQKKKTFSDSQRLRNILVTKSQTFKSLKIELQDLLKY